MPAKKTDIIVCAHGHPFCSGSPWSLGIQEVQESVSKLEALAKNTGIPSVRRRFMEAAFHLK